jgi:hypothetical protein
MRALLDDRNVQFIDTNLSFPALQIVTGRPEIVAEHYSIVIQNNAQAKTSDI